MGCIRASRDVGTIFKSFTAVCKIFSPLRGAESIFANFTAVGTHLVRTRGAGGEAALQNNIGSFSPFPSGRGAGGWANKRFYKISRKPSKETLSSKQTHTEKPPVAHKENHPARVLAAHRPNPAYAVRSHVH